jgi:tetratricopeptide (TPR) repeat protein
MDDVDQGERTVRQWSSFTGLGCFVCSVAITMSGCAADEATTDQLVPTLSEEQVVQSVSLPDLSHMTAPVREQIRQRYSSLTSAIEQLDTTSAELSDAYGEMGNVLMAARYVDATEPFYFNAQTLAPRDRRWPYYLGHLYTSQGAFAKAAAAFERALALEADDVPTMISLGEVHLEQGQPEVAEPLFTRALSHEPSSIWARIGLGRAALARRDYVQAVECLEEALVLDQEAAGIHYPLAMAYRGLGDLETAEVHLAQRDAGKVRRPDPLMRTMGQSLESPSTFEREGIQALGNGDLEGAAALFRQGIELAPDNPSLRHRLGTALFLMGDEREGLAQFEEAVRVSPDYAQAHYSLGLLLEESGRLEDAIQRFSLAVRYEPSYVEARLRLARALRRVGRPAEALSEYAQIIETDPRTTEATFGYAVALAGLGRYQEARDRLAEGMEFNPDQPMFALALARLLAAAPDERARDGQRAVMLVQELLAQERSFELGEVMAMALAEVGQYAEAVSWQREIMSMAEEAGRDDIVSQLAENLRLYEGGDPCRTPWLDDNMP